MTVATLVSAGAVAKTTLATLGMIAVQGTIVALLALAIARAGRLRPSWQAAIWLVVIVKFALPWGPALPWSLSDLVAGLFHHGAGATPSALPATLAAPLPAARAWPAVGYLAVATIWLVGAALSLTRALVRSHRLARAARLAKPAPFAALALLAELARRAKLPVPRLVVAASGPHVVGGWHSTIVVPAVLVAEPALLRAALLHELAHVRRRDAIGRAFQLVACAAFFWWPVALLASRRLELAREAACDAWAVEAGELPRPTYARLLVRMAALHLDGEGTLAGSAAERRRGWIDGSLALAMPRALDARVRAVLGPPAARRSGLGYTLALAAWVAVVLGGARTAGASAARIACRYTPQLAAKLMLAHPEADLDGDGVLSRDEACELQAQLRARQDELVSTLDPYAAAELESLLDEPLCCNCDQPEATTPELMNAGTPSVNTCQQVEGVVR